MTTSARNDVRRLNARRRRDRRQRVVGAADWRCADFRRSRDDADADKRQPYSGYLEASEQVSEGGDGGAEG